MIKLAAYLTGYGPRKDFSYSLRFETQELSDEELVELKNHYQKYGYLLFKENEYIVDDIPDEEPSEPDTKSSSEILRNRMYVYWKKKGIGGDFESWRRGQLEKIGQGYLEKIK